MSNTDLEIIQQIVMKMTAYEVNYGKPCTRLYLGLESCKKLAKELNCNTWDIFYNQGKPTVAGLRVYGVVDPLHTEVA